jgi:hypothetical protein
MRPPLFVLYLIVSFFIAVAPSCSPPHRMPLAKARGGYISGQNTMKSPAQKSRDYYQ